MAVLGVDACKDGWVGIRLQDGAAPCAVWGATIAALAEAAGHVTVMAIDIPIGLLDSGTRRAEALARKEVGRRASSVFATPPRRVFEGGDYAVAAALCRELSGQGLSKQSYALRHKVLEVDAWIGGRPDAATQVVEAHPEVSFAQLAGAPLADAKSTWAGFQHRRRLLARAGIVLDGDLGLGRRRVGPDDVLDAAVVAWTAARIARGEHRTLPDPPQVLPGTRHAAIWV